MLNNGDPVGHRRIDMHSARPAPFVVLVSPAADLDFPGRLRQRHLGIAYLAAYLEQTNSRSVQFIDADFLGLGSV